VIIDAAHPIETSFSHLFTRRNKRKRAQQYSKEKEIDGFSLHRSIRNKKMATVPRSV
jgi:hypothetical protein